MLRSNGSRPAPRVAREARPFVVASATERRQDPASPARLSANALQPVTIASYDSTVRQQLLELYGSLGLSSDESPPRAPAQHSAVA